MKRKLLPSDMKTFLVGYAKYFSVIPKFRHLSKEEQDSFMYGYMRDTKLLITLLKEVQRWDKKS